MKRHRVDWEAMRLRTAGTCFICEFLAGNPRYAHHTVYEDEDSVAFLNRFPVLVGHTLVASRVHKERVTGDFSAAEYVGLQRVVYRVGEALRRAVPTERLYVLSLGSQQGNRHVHWHLAPLPPGVPFDEQQFRALDREDVLDLPDEDMALLASHVRAMVEPDG